MARDMVQIGVVNSINSLPSRDKSRFRATLQTSTDANGDLRSPSMSAILPRTQALPGNSLKSPLMRRTRLIHLVTSIASICAAQLVALPGASAEVTPSFPQQTLLSTNQPYGSSIIVADFDGDGLPDIAAASLYDNQIAWYRNNGDGTFSSANVISTASVGPWTIAAADIDADGRIDIVSASQGENKIAWYRNVGGSQSTMFGSRANNQRIISTTASAFSITVGAVIADIDGDGLWDVVSAFQSDNKIAWYRNLGGGNFGWVAANPDANQRVISTAGLSPSSVAAGDLDGDGITDLAVASINDDTLAWFKGGVDANGAPTFTRYVISTNQLRALSVTIADMNHDHRPDIICAAPFASKITYFKNMNGVPDAAEPFFAEEQIVSDVARGTSSVAVADINRDGNPDVISTLLLDDKVTWYAGSAPDAEGGITFGPEMLISSDVQGPASVIAADFNGDTVIDVASASQNDAKIAVYFNGGQFDGDVTLAPSLLAPTDGTVTTTPVKISYSLPEDALTGSVTVSFVSGATLRQLVLAPDQGSAGAHTFSFDPSNPGASSEIESGSSSIADGTYVVTISYQDALGNPAATSRPAIGVVIDAVAPFLPGASTSILGAKGSPVPGAGTLGSGVPADATLRVFGMPSINDAGHLAVTSTYSSGAGVRQVILGPSPDGQTAVQIGSGDPVPDTGGTRSSNLQFVSFQDVLLNDADAIAFIGTVRGTGIVRSRNDRGIWTNAGDGQLRQVAREGDVAAGLSVRFDAITSVALSATFADETTRLANPAGRTDIAFVARLAGVGVTLANDEGVWIHESTSSTDGSLRLVLRKGQSLALRNGAPKRVKSFIALAANDGTQGHGRGAVPAGVAARVIFTDNTQALVRVAADGVIADVAVTGDAIADGSAGLVRFGVAAQNTRGDTLSSALLSGRSKNSALLFASPSFGASVAVREEDAADGITDGFFSSFKSGAVNDDQSAAFIATAAGRNVSAANNDGIWFAPAAATPVLIAREGTQPPGIADGARWEIFRSLVLPDGARGPVFVADVMVPAIGRPNPARISAANDTGVWAVDSNGVLRLIVREGDVLPGTTSPIRALALLGNITGSPAQTRSYNGNSEIIYRATLADGSEVIAKARVP